ncbi:MAG: undecaprenyldiphospho-muramoylpentapeptide beta-N-acetylglucosaminyltransferase [Clostridia bacterium]|nr:undecaprenyldiphospho-muramoylpentapeptide beta-N-acetylglucosaminyltransferase [Clostridia bacterium]
MKIVFTGGGTAGHVMPNIALIRRLQAEGWDVSYIGSKNGMEKDLIAALGNVPYYGVSVGKLRRYLDLKNLSDPFRVIRGCSEARRILKKLQPDVVFSKGGFVSVPVVVGAASLGRKRPHIIAHESDYTPGLANRIAGRFADTVCCTFEDTVSKIAHGRPVFTGTPIRPELYKGDKEKGLAFAGLDGKKPVLFIMGGSSGAVRVNLLVRSALDRLLPVYDIIHLCGKNNVDASAARPGYVQFDYISEQLPDLLAAADVVISRAGANAVFELMALAKPAVLIPLGLDASRGDQILNAKYCERKGYATRLDQDTATPDSLADAVNHLYENRLETGAAMAQDTKLDGTDEVLEVIREAAERSHGKKKTK